MSASPEEIIARERTAIRRAGLSRPLRLAVDAGLLPDDARVMDYGCGHGDDVRYLRDSGYEVSGWDPVHRPDGAREPADIVNLGYVINVIEDPEEREEALRSAWKLAANLLIVSARLSVEPGPVHQKSYSDGVLTSKGTFQKFFEQAELRDWIDSALDAKSVAAAPGVFFVFRAEESRQRYLSSRHRHRAHVPVVRQSDVLFEKNEEILTPLMEFYAERGRLPEVEELPGSDALVGAFGSIRRAFAVVRVATGKEQWEEIREEREQDLLVYLALEKFGGRPKISDLPSELQLDIKAFFGAYTRACAAADELLFSVGDQGLIGATCAGAPLGKITRDALYVHVSAVPELPPVLRVFEGCARVLVGEVEEANILKLRRDKPRISYLQYPTFDDDPHPQLVQSLLVRLDDLSLSIRDYSESENPPILHRKELFVPSDYPRRGTFERLSRQEERHGLFEDSVGIGWRESWRNLLMERGFELRGHRLVRA